MDTPDGGNYWGKGGRDPAWDRYFAAGKAGSAAAWHSCVMAEGGSYTGVLLTLVALWAVFQSLRKAGFRFLSRPTQIHLVPDRPDRRLAPPEFWSFRAVLSILLRVALCLHDSQSGQIHACVAVGLVGHLRARRLWLEPPLSGGAGRGDARPGVTAAILVGQGVSVRPEVGDGFGARVGGQPARVADLRLRPQPPGGLSARGSVRRDHGRRRSPRSACGRWVGSSFCWRSPSDSSR